MQKWTERAEIPDCKSKILYCEQANETVKADLRIFRRELRDIPDYEELKIDIGGLLSFADFFFDGLLADYMVQSKINEARNKVQNTIQRVEHLLTELRRCC